MGKTSPKIAYALIAPNPPVTLAIIIFLLSQVGS